jgi:hypothetical protein
MLENMKNWILFFILRGELCLYLKKENYWRY